MTPITESPTRQPSISVVVIGRNEGPRLVRCLDSIRASHYPPEAIELIYVDSQSTDDSGAQAERRGARVIRVNPSRPSAATGRNAGWAAATHDLVHFFDGDTLVHPDWFATAVAAMNDDQAACVFGRREEIAPRETIYNLWTHYDWFVPPGPAFTCAGDALFRREVLRKMNGFDASLIAGEEPDLCYRIRSQLGMTILSVAAPMTRHDMGMRHFRQYWRRCTRTGHAYAEVGGRHPGMGRWRAHLWKNMAHVLLLFATIWCALALRSLWPLVAWVGLLALLIVRNAFRLRGQTESMRDALLYSLHHYIAKLPITVGQLDYWVRRAFRRTPKPLIEYR